MTLPSDQLLEIDGNQNLLLEQETNEIPEHFRYNLSDSEYDDDLDFESNINENVKKEKTHSVCYQVKMEKPIFKCHRYYLIKDNKTLFTAKRKYDKTIIGEGENCHINQSKQPSVAKITRDFRGFDVVHTNEQDFKINFLKIGQKFLVKTSFDHKSGRQFWKPNKENRKSTLINGEYNRKPIQSDKNVVLMNPKNRPAFIVRKMEKKVFEIECHPDCDPVVAFAITISQITGPIVS